MDIIGRADVEFWRVRESSPDLLKLLHVNSYFETWKDYLRVSPIANSMNSPIQQPKLSVKFPALLIPQLHIYTRISWVDACWKLPTGSAFEMQSWAMPEHHHGHSHDAHLTSSCFMQDVHSKVAQKQHTQNNAKIARGHVYFRLARNKVTRTL